LAQSYVAPWRTTLAAALLVLFTLSQRRNRFIVLAFALALGSSVMSLRQQSLQSSVVTKHFGASASVTVQFTTDPHQSSKKVSGQNFLPLSYSALASLREIQIDGSTYKLHIPVRLIATDKEIAKLLPGQKVLATVQILRSKEPRVAALLIANQGIRVLNPPSPWAQALGKVRLGLRAASGTGDAGSLIPGMVLGDTSLQTEKFCGDMRRSGLTHLVAVSGANFAIVSAFILWCAQFLFRTMRFRIIATAIALIVFIALVRPSPSVLRAAAMAAVLLIAYATKRGADSLPALGFAIAAVVIGDPWQGRDPGFALSVLATAGLLLFAPKIIAYLARFLPNFAAQAIAPPIAAMIFCAPVIVSIAGYLSPMSILANLLAAPAVAPITVIGFIAALISPLSPHIATVLVTCVKPLAWWVASVADWAAGFRVLTLSKGLIGFTVALMVIALIFTLPRKVFIAGLIIILSLTFVQRFPGSNWQVANCDIGQGDGAAVNLGNHRAIVIDTGPDPELIDRCLKQLSIREIPLLILTHGHADHIAGLSGAVRGRKVGTRWFGNVSRGTTAQFDGVHVKVLWPDNGEYDPNNSSIAARIDTPDFSLFACGDMEPLTQAVIASELRNVDIYKVCHHGSAYQDESFTRALSPQVAMISVGAGNSYGHPAPKTLGLLAQAGAKVLRTDLDGAIAIAAQRHRLKIRTSKGNLNFIRWE
jgi:competence protein ComEC